MSFEIKPAAKEDAPIIAKGIATALHIGEEDAAISLATDEEWRTWNDIFTELAARDDSQYSYLNTLKAIDDKDDILGIIIGYDGARLHQLREAFFNAVKKHTGEDMSAIADETDPEEWYLDSLAVWKEHRGQGIGEALLREAVKKAREAGKPAGLLVDKGNPKARKLYEKVGFRYVDDRPFVDVIMDHMRTGTSSE